MDSTIIKQVKTCVAIEYINISVVASILTIKCPDISLGLLCMMITDSHIKTDGTPDKRLKLLRNVPVH